MRVALVHSSSDLYGSDRMLEATVRALVPLGAEVDALVPADGPLVPRLRDAGATVHTGGVVVARRGRGIADPTQFLRVPRAWRVLRRADVVHANTSATLTPLLLPPGRPLVWSVREKFGLSRVERTLAGAIARRADVVLAPSKGAVRDFVAAAGHPVEARVVPDALGPEPDDVAYSPPGRPAICCVGRFNQWKRQSDLIAAFAALAPEFPGASLVLAGGPLPGQESYLEESRRAVREHGLDDRVDFVGEVSSGEAVMRQCDVVAVPSSRETFGLVILEGMRSGRPVVTSATDGARDIVTPDVDGVVHEVGDVRGLESGLRRILADSALATRVAEAGRLRAADFGIDRVGAATMAAYETAIAGAVRQDAETHR